MESNIYVKGLRAASPIQPASAHFNVSPLPSASAPGRVAASLALAALVLPRALAAKSEAKQQTKETAKIRFFISPLDIDEVIRRRLTMDVKPSSWSGQRRLLNVLIEAREGPDHWTWALPTDSGTDKA